METKCPHCSKGKLEYSQNADILYKIVDGKLVPQLDIDSIGWLDSTYLYCDSCGIDDSLSPKLAIIKGVFDANV